MVADDAQRGGVVTPSGRDSVMLMLVMADCRGECCPLMIAGGKDS